MLLELEEYLTKIKKLAEEHGVNNPGFLASLDEEEVETQERVLEELDKVLKDFSYKDYSFRAHRSTYHTDKKKYVYIYVYGRRLKEKKRVHLGKFISLDELKRRVDKIEEGREVDETNNG